jgi:hypothetical protein
MYISQKIQKLFIFILILFTASTLIFAQKSGEKGNKGEKKPVPEGRPVLWEAVDIKQQNLLAGPGGDEMRPDLSSVTFVRDETAAGYSTKYRIKDGAGHIWIAKTGLESQPETAAVRLISAIGYKSEINYLVPELTVPGKGTFKNVRLEARPDDVERSVNWDWKKNPFVGSNELQGLKIMMALLNNWDLKTENNKVLAVDKGGQPELDYIVSDLGATFGKIGSIPLFWRIAHDRNKPGEYEKTKFLDGVKQDRVRFVYSGKLSELFGDISVAQARWLADLLVQLNEQQISDAFRAANYSDEDTAALTAKVKDRIEELDAATKRPNVSTDEKQ